MRVDRLAGVIESVLFVLGEAGSVESLAEALEEDAAQVTEALALLEEKYEKDECGLQLKRFAGYVQLASKAVNASYVESVLQPAQKQSLSQSAMETLAIVAYRQPVTRGEVEAVRGVQCDYALQALTQKGLIRDAGRKETLGRPILYATTKLFLSHFGLSGLFDLPPLPPGDSQAEKDKE
jgi:segregation and condensation protein B